jgi:hypothetical protein
MISPYVYLSFLSEPDAKKLLTHGARLFLQSSELGPPSSHPQASVAPRFWFRGGILAFERVSRGSQFGRGE